MYILSAVLSILIAEGVGILSAFLSMSPNMTYQNLKKPFFSPPGWVFPVIWAILFLLMGIASYRVWTKRKEGKNVNKALVLYGIQLFLNFMWSIIFFRFNLYGAAFLELIILLIFILLTTFEFYKIDKIAAYLMIPYIIWVSFAGILNCAIWILNR